MDGGDPSDERSDEEFASLTPQSRSHDDWGAVTGQPKDVIREPGSHVGPYIVLEQLGAGGMGVVYSAYDAKLDRKIALKVLRSEGNDETAAVARLRLVAEGRALARVSHPNVVTVFDVGTVESEVYIAMELVRGQTLSRWRDASARAWPEVVEMFTDIAAGLGAVHDASLVHRDVKPDNILIDQDGRPRVTDFGLARPESEAEVPSSLELQERALVQSGTGEREPLHLTRTGARVGTPAYMASEQMQGREATPASDQFALCVALWECLYGQRPFHGTSWVSLVMAVSEGQIREPPSPPAGTPIPTWLRGVLERGLHPDPAERWPSVRALREALLAGDPLRNRRRWLAGLSVLVLGGAGVAGALGARAAEERAQRGACESLAAQAAERWNDDARKKLRAAFASSSIDDALELEAGVETVLDDFVTTWSSARSEVCLAPLESRATDSELLSRRADCLDDKLHTLDSLLDTFATGDDVIVSRARSTAEGLTDVERCSDERRLLRQPPRPADPQVRKRVRDLERELSQTLIHEHVGHYDEGLRRAKEALAAARTTEHVPLLATASYRVAVFEEKLGNYEEAVDAWATAFHDASVSDDELLAAEAASALAFAEGYQLSRYDAGIRWSQMAGILLERLDMTASLAEARRLDTLAVLNEMKGRLDESIALHHRSLDLRRSLVPATHQSVGYGLANLAGVLQKTRRFDEAEAALLESLSIFEDAFGPDNPTTAHVVNNLAGLYQKTRQYDKADPLLQRVLAIWSTRLGDDHPDVGDVYNALGEIRRGQGNLDDAIAMHERALRVHRRAHDGEPHPDIARTANQLGQVQALAGQPDAATASFEAALAAVKERSEHDDDRGRAYHGLADLALRSGAHDDARVYFQRSKRAFEVASGDHENWLARARIGLAVLDQLQHDTAAGPSLEAVATDENVGTHIRIEALAWQQRFARHDAGLQARLDALLANTDPDVAVYVQRVLSDEPSAPAL